LRSHRQRGYSDRLLGKAPSVVTIMRQAPIIRNSLGTAQLRFISPHLTHYADASDDLHVHCSRLMGARIPRDCALPARPHSFPRCQGASSVGGDSPSRIPIVIESLLCAFRQLGGELVLSFATPFPHRSPGTLPCSSRFRTNQTCQDQTPHTRILDRSSCPLASLALIAAAVSFLARCC